MSQIEIFTVCSGGGQLASGTK